MGFLDINGLAKFSSKLLTKIGTAFDGLEERVTANETSIEGKADTEHSHENLNELIKELYVNAYDGSESQLNMLVALSGGLNESVKVGPDTYVYICNNRDVYVAGTEYYDDEPHLTDKAITRAYVLNGLKTVGFALFSDTIGLTSVKIPNNVTEICNCAFDYCDDLQDIEIPSSVTSIGAQVFRGCTSLTSITIPSSVTNIGNYAFDGCSSLTTITINKSQDSITGQPWGAAGAEVIWLG